MSKKGCITKLQKAYKDLDPKQISEIVKSMDEIKKGQGYGNKANEFRKQTIEELQMQAEFKTRQIIARKDMNTFLKTPEFKGRHNDAFQAKFEGVDYLSKGGNDHFNINKQSFRGKNMNILHQATKKHMNIIADGKFDVDIAEAVEALNQSKSISKYPEHVRETAQAMKTMNNSLIKDLQDVGVIIKTRDDFIARQSHNREPIIAAKFDKWYDSIEGRLDHEKSFGHFEGGKKVKEILQSIYSEIESGDMENTLGNFGGKRVLHFKSAKDWAEYNALFGYGSLIDAATMTVNSASKAFASAKVFGPDPKAAWLHMENKIKNKLDPTEKAKFMDTTMFGAKNKRDTWFKEMFGYERHPGRENVANVQRTISLVNSAAKLGNALKSTVTDLGFSAGNLRGSAGMSGFIEFNMIKDFGKMFTSNKELHYWANVVDMDVTNMLSGAYDRYGAFQGGGRNGALQTFANKTIQWSGLGRQSAVAKVSNARSFSLNLGRNIDKNWGGLNTRLRAGLERFNIDEADWEIMRHGSEEYRGGVIGVTGEGIRNLPDTTISGTKRNLLATKVSNYLADMAKVGSPEASGLERGIITQGFSPDDPLGATLRVAGQFKSFPLAIPRVLRRISLSNPDLDGKRLWDNLRLQGDLVLLAATMTEVTVLAGIGIQLGNILKGKKPQEVDAAFIADSIARGAMPLMATYMMDAARGEYSKFGRSLFKDLAGPTFGQIDDIIGVLEGTIRMDSKVGIKATKLLMNNLPGANLPFVKTGLQKLFITDMFDYLNPGYEARLKSRANRQGTEFLFNPY